MKNRKILPEQVHSPLFGSAPAESVEKSAVQVHAELLLHLMHDRERLERVVISVPGRQPSVHNSNCGLYC